MARTSEGQGCGPARPPRNASRPTPAERALVLGGFALAAVWTGACAIAGACPGPVPGTGPETAGAVWLAALGWAVAASLALALRRGFRDGDWSAFRRSGLPEDKDTLDWSLQSGAYLDMEIAEQHERLMRGD